MQDVTLPSRHVTLCEEEILGHKITFEGDGTLSYRYTEEGGLSGLVGKGTTGITIDGNIYALAQEPVNIAWFKVDEHNLAPDVETAYALKCDRPCCLTLPFDASGMSCELCFNYQLNTTQKYPFSINDSQTVVDITADAVETWMVFYK